GERRAGCAAARRTGDERDIARPELRDPGPRPGVSRAPEHRNAGRSPTLPFLHLMTSPPETIRNVALVAHVDHGKTTLVDAMLRASGDSGAAARATHRDRDLDCLEREKCITIFAKAAQIRWKGHRINLVDTPCH